MLKKFKSKILPCLTCALLFHYSNLKANEELFIGLNVDRTNYSNVCPIFNNVMKSASEWSSFTLNEWTFNTEKMSHIPLDPQGYPLELPIIVDEKPQGVRFLFNNTYKGNFVFLYEGEGSFDFRQLPHFKKNGQDYITLTGEGGHKWIDILESKKGNHVRNIQILPEEDMQNPGTFYPLFLKGLKPFHCLRFMDWMAINNSKQTTWDTRAQPEYYTQGLENGVAIEYAIELCNTLGCDAWFCIPHKADDQYIRSFAQLVLQALDSRLKVYIEYSNEIWNWGFQQSHYVLENAPGALNKYVSRDLESINPAQEDFVPKDSYMMQRVFKIWSDVFGEEHRKRLIRVAAVQQAWVDNTRVVLTYLFKKDASGKDVNAEMYKTSLGLGCDAIAPAAYFYYSDEDPNIWNSMKPDEVTALMVLNSVEKEYPKQSGKWTEQTAEIVNAWKVDYLVYEGGQHLVPYQNTEWPYVNAIWDAQINPKMYDIYKKLTLQLSSPPVNCKLFCAYQYTGERKTRWGSWGHLENVYQLDDLKEIRSIAPKYAALLDANISKDKKEKTAVSQKN